MKTYWLIFLVSLSSMMIFSCKNNESQTNQITADIFNCPVNTTRAENYYKNYGMNNPRITVDDESENRNEEVVKKAFEKLSNVPEPYLQYIFDNTKDTSIPVNILSAPNPEQKGGLTSFYDSKSAISTAILYTELWCLVHEFGHASEGYHWKLDPKFSSNLSKLTSFVFSNETYKNNISEYLQNYSTLHRWSKEREIFAELFDTWYCSRAARENLKNGLPEVYNFANGVIEDGVVKSKPNLLPPLPED